MSIITTMPIIPEQRKPLAIQELPSSSSDGSHLPWKTFRQNVLAPHRIRIMDEAPMQGLLPEPLLTMIERETMNAGRFDAQKKAFREQIKTGQGFGVSPLFPPNILPPIDSEPYLARCMVPTFSRDGLPIRASDHTKPLYELVPPRPSLSCGFSLSALTEEETQVLPLSSVTKGIVVHFDTGYISPGAPLYCPFLVFERARSENHVETTKNQASIGGAWCIRALEMLYTEAWKGQMTPEMPISFSCTIDNHTASLYFHWTENDCYCMAPLCKLDLDNDDDFTTFLVWIESIGKWAVAHHLPLIKTALQRLRVKQAAAQPIPKPPKLSVTTGMCPEDVLVKSLRTTFTNVPWRFEDDEFTPVSSSTASWGSPIVTEATFANLQSPTIPPSTATSLPRSAVSKRFPHRQGQPTPPPAYAQNTELVWQKRFGHAMDEIRDLQKQLQSLQGDFAVSKTSIEEELTEVKANVSSVLRKETLTQRHRSFSTGVAESWTIQNGPRSPLVNKFHPTIVLEGSSSTKNKPEPLKKQPSAPNSPGLASPGFTSTELLSPGLLSQGMVSPTYSIFSEGNVVIVPPPPQMASLWKFTAIMASGHLLATLIPVAIIRVLVLGLITDACILAFASPHYPSSLAYLASLFKQE